MLAPLLQGVRGQRRGDLRSGMVMDASGILDNQCKGSYQPNHNGARFDENKGGKTWVKDGKRHSVRPPL